MIFYYHYALEKQGTNDVLRLLFEARLDNLFVKSGKSWRAF
jgi:hypothetical protein